MPDAEQQGRAVRRAAWVIAACGLAIAAALQASARPDEHARAEREANPPRCVASAPQRPVL